MNDLSQFDTTQTNALLQTLGVTGASGFSVANIMAWIIFGSIGFVAFFYGKKQENLRALVIGLCMMGYPYFVKNTFWLYAVGIIFCLMLYFWRE